MTADRSAQIVAMHRAGRSLRAIGRDVGLSHEGVRLILIDAGVITARDLIDVDMAWRLYQQGRTMAAIADALGVTPSAVCMLFKRHGLKARRVGRPRKAHPLHC